MTSLRTCQSGFILPATILLLSIITIAASLFALWTERRLTEAQQYMEESRSARDTFATLNTLLYILSTGSPTPQGIKVSEKENRQAPLLNLDNRPYKGYGETLFSIQDESGLLGVNFFNHSRWEQLLSRLNIPIASRGPLLAKLADYEDKNTLFRLNGAEEQQYQRAKRPPPPNRQLLTNHELRNVLSWDQFPQLWDNNRILKLTSANFSGPININSAPVEILSTLAGVDEADAEKIVNFRQRIIIKDLSMLEQLLGKKLSQLDMHILFRPSFFHRIDIWDKKSGRGMQYNLQLTPGSPRGIPWNISTALPFHRQVQSGSNINDEKSSQDREKNISSNYPTLPLFP